MPEFSAVASGMEAEAALFVVRFVVALAVVAAGMVWAVAGKRFWTRVAMTFAAALALLFAGLAPGDRKTAYEAACGDVLASASEGQRWFSPRDLVEIENHCGREAVATVAAAMQQSPDGSYGEGRR